MNQLRAKRQREAVQQFHTFSLNTMGTDPKLAREAFKRTSENQFINSFNILEYWQNSARKARYNLLHRMIIRALGVQLTSSSSERVFFYTTVLERFN
jgi:hAT family C-terminal dimerisation region